MMLNKGGKIESKSGRKGYPVILGKFICVSLLFGSNEDKDWDYCFICYYLTFALTFELVFDFDFEETLDEDCIEIFSALLSY